MFIKKKDFEELKNRIEVLEFQRDHPNGLDVRSEFSRTEMEFEYKIKFVKDNKVKSYKLPIIYPYQIWFVDDDGCLTRWRYNDWEYFEFDIENEMLVKIKEIEKADTKKDIRKPKKPKPVETDTIETEQTVEDLVDKIKKCNQCSRALHEARREQGLK